MKTPREKDVLRVRQAHHFDTEIEVPGDKSISHRAVILSSISNGSCRISNFLEGEDCRSTASAMSALGVQIETPEPGIVVVEGCRGKFRQPDADLYCGNSGTTMRLMAGLLSACPFRTRMTGDESLTKRPMKRVVDPLTQMGARLSGDGEKSCPPLVVQGRPLSAITYKLPVASAQVKSAVLLAGLFAKGTTTVVETTRSRDHTERMLDFFQVKCRREEVRESGRPLALRRLEELRISVEGGQIPESRDVVVPGDISSAAFWLVATAALPGARLLVKNVGLNPTRTAIIDVLVRMGARVREVVETSAHGEPAGTIDIKGGQLHGTTIEGDEIPNLIDEIPILSIAAALADGTTVIRNAAELRVKETDRIAAVATNLRAMGVEVEELPDGLAIQGGKPLRGARLQSYGDHRIAMSFAIAGLFASTETVIENTACVQTSYPTFAQTLRRLSKGGGSSKTTPVISSLDNRSRRGKKKGMMIVVAIDGPAASGKSSVARRLAMQLGFQLVNSGSLYRAVTWEILRQGANPDDWSAVAHAVARASLDCEPRGTDEALVSINGREPGDALRDDLVNRSVSAVSAVPLVRDLVSGLLRKLATQSNVVVEGRDIGSVVFPDTPYKFYLDARPDIRRLRRAAEGQRDQIEARDRMDASRSAAPLVRPAGSILIDTSDLSLDEVVAAIAKKLADAGLCSTR